MLADETPPMMRPMNRQARFGAQPVARKLTPMPAIEYSSTGRRPTRSLMAPSMGMKMNCSKPKTAAMMPYQNACASLPLTKSPIRMGSTGTTRPMPSMSMKTQTRMKLRLPARSGAAGEDGK